MRHYIQAKIESFADSYVEDFSEDQRILLKNSRMLSQTDGFLAQTGELPDEVAMVVQKHRDNYLVFSESIPPEQLSEGADNAKFYEERFEKVVKELIEQIECAGPTNVPGYLGRGANSYAFKIESEDEVYAVKLGKVCQINFELRALRKGKGLENISQLVSYSFEDAAIVMKLLAGENIAEFDSATRPKYTDAELERLIRTVDEMHKAGLVPDPKPSNFIYNPERGISLLDYHINRGGCSVGDSIIDLQVALTYASDKPFDAFQRTVMVCRLVRITREKFPHIFNEILRRNNELKSDPRSSCYGKGYFDKQLLLEFGVSRRIITELESLGFF